MLVEVIARLLASTTDACANGMIMKVMERLRNYRILICTTDRPILCPVGGSVPMLKEQLCVVEHETLTGGEISENLSFDILLRSCKIKAEYSRGCFIFLLNLWVVQHS